MNESNSNHHPEYDLADIVIGRVHGFRVGGEHFRIYPVTLGKMLILSPYMAEIGIGGFLGGSDPYLSVLNLVREKKELCATVLAIHTTPNRQRCLEDTEGIRHRTELFAREMEDGDLASLLVVTLTGDKLEQVVGYLGLDEEQKRMSEVMKAKDCRNSLSFGAKSIIGAFIVPLKKMNFTVKEILYECGYSFLRLVLMDQHTSVYMSDDELSRVTGSTGALIDSEGADRDLQLEVFFANRGIHVQ